MEVVLVTDTGAGGASSLGMVLLRRWTYLDRCLGNLGQLSVYPQAVASTLEYIEDPESAANNDRATGGAIDTA